LTGVFFFERIFAAEAVARAAKDATAAAPKLKIKNLIVSFLLMTCMGSFEHRNETVCFKKILQT
jgi:hypothetical protein